MGELPVLTVRAYKKHNLLQFYNALMGAILVGSIISKTKGFRPTNLRMLKWVI